MSPGVEGPGVQEDMRDGPTLHDNQNRDQGQHTHDSVNMVGEVSGVVLGVSTH